MRRENKLYTKPNIFDRNEFSVTRRFQDEVSFYLQMANWGMDLYFVGSIENCGVS
jgi:hypothetical protein